MALVYQLLCQHLVTENFPENVTDLHHGLCDCVYFVQLPVEIPFNTSVTHISTTKQIYVTLVHQLLRRRLVT
jgi:hypothetical protein